MTPGGSAVRESYGRYRQNSGLRKHPSDIARGHAVTIVIENRLRAAQCERIGDDPDPPSRGLHGRGERHQRRDRDRAGGRVRDELDELS